MPLRNGIDAPVRADPGEQKCADEVKEDREQTASEDENETSRRAQEVKFAEKKRDHKTCLKRTNARTGILEANHSRRQLDDVAVLQRSDAEEIQELHVNRSHHSHQLLHGDLFELRRPWDADQKEENRKREMLYPGSTAGAG